MTAEKVRNISRKGGTAAHEKGTAHEWDREEARKAGRLGGRRSGRKRKIHPEDLPDDE
jgi:general stress protein YciG